MATKNKIATSWPTAAMAVFKGKPTLAGIVALIMMAAMLGGAAYLANFAVDQTKAVAAEKLRGKVIVAACGAVNALHLAMGAAGADPLPADVDKYVQERLAIPGDETEKAVGHAMRLSDKTYSIAFNQSLADAFPELASRFTNIDVEKHPSEICNDSAMRQP